MPHCPNAAAPANVKVNFERLAARDYVGQQQAWHYVSAVMESYAGLAPRATCTDWTLHFSGPSGSGKSFLAELIADAALEPWEEESYSLSQMGVATSGGALGGALGMVLGGPVTAGLASSVGAYGARRAWQAALSLSPSLSSTFRVPRPFPSQCGVLQHKFARGSNLAEVEQWEYQVARELQKEPTSVIVVDDVGRLHGAEAFAHFGRLLCGVGGNAVPEFRTGPGDAPRVAAAEALFVLTSDLEIDPGETAISCEVEQWEPMLETVRAQSARFWSERGLHTPDWWHQVPLVPFRELCAEELSQVTRRYLDRQAEVARRQIEAELQRRSSWAVGKQRVLEWTGTVKHGPTSLSVLDAYVSDAIASSKLVGGRMGGWVVADFHRAVMKPAMQALTMAHAEGNGVGALVRSGRSRHVTTWLNYTTVTYTSELCLEVSARAAPGAIPSVRFQVMQHMCT